MIIGIPADKEDMNGPVSGSFGRAPYYFVYDDKKESGIFILNTAATAQGGAGVKAAQLLVDQNTDIVISPQLGENAAQVLQASNTKLYQSKEGSLMDNILMLKDGKLGQLMNVHEGYHKH
ncbi:NifB/NifX family molybdenum-iron cluster-binding protein [Gudongella sp. DL1XJH-153]|uniref:NifB/NifX family molybdenum-iron cluster-binding protein n=1 Tax=Gudongella sp. DL1XJH-153 TaxID=3409804 RepID=UPI003BB65674